MTVSRGVTAILLATAFAAGTGLTAAASATATAAAPARAAQERLEAARAECMKQAGYKYIPESPLPRPDEARLKRLNGDHAALQAYRAKYGFGVWATQVYPKDPAVNGPDVESPNNAIVLALPEKEHKAYKAANDKCFSQAVKSVVGKRVASQEDYYRQFNAALKRLTARELDSDRNLVKLAADFGTCLKGRDYEVASAKPGALAERGREAFMQDRTDVAKERGLKPPARAKGRKVHLVPAMKPEEAKPYLDKEIAAALDDLTCGKDFYAAYSPRAFQLHQQVAADFGRA
ncbi:hypothetical protein [Sinosporangium siamense]|uniref:Uncharacterized protein n=1 Tax=Sinosporangium siamense TaxID=1367973 RepID=A0A919RG07_9ACTN|nr:hypothetical protein [Sinosporangium siamense]GII92075.1 hypothetical protein Ssi02_23060 [Sinosporangium siamense]